MSDLETLFSLKGKVALLTGGAGVLAGAIARGLGRAGARLVITDIGPLEGRLAELQGEGLEAWGYRMNVLDRGEIERVAEQVQREVGPVNILINLAGGNVPEATVGPERPFFDLPLEALEKVVALNLFGGAILPSQVFARQMVQAGEGVIINVSSMAAFRPLTRVVGYAAAKAAVSNFTQWLAVHLAQEYSPKIRVNAIAPGFFLTQQNRYLLLDEQGNLTPRGRAILEHTPMRRFGDPEDLVGTVIWLASPASAFVTGVVVPIDGGFNAYAGV
ncbi:SDR family oxidoreductase [Thermoflexus sp.]|uniref:SDR family oxidoreductase n=1 Tax=Thermoflexus sp. TaxID=1969742 RepID=UPI0025F74A03|nr:SDR family oxidoreductase [Thermoflexus sp.]MDW8180074.1 SDR family oxidoreductase [Anaerolineae bacterium]MCS6964668.1 SDR family oxidoreductase [Thermoflexus sp.]MCS7350623.1 SDR family oxidoreductase [Thermoflexus sp.]MCX7689697.1 SDR family oxidoreductase [Thermoflexus sp.]MDW8185173.1 SDR family oxidoreductase [Anaerolineae bacterium]